LKWAPTDSIEITPSVSYQRVEVNDGYDMFWPGPSSKGNLVRPVYDAGDPATDPALNAFPFPNEASGDDRFYLFSVGMNWNLGAVELISNTSYFDRDNLHYMDMVEGYISFYSISDDPDVWYPTEGFKGLQRNISTQENFVQEIRLQSTDDSARLRWVAGLFYSDADQTEHGYIAQNWLNNASQIRFAWYPGPPAVNDGPPFGPGSTAFQNMFGLPPTDDGRIWSLDASANDKQYAGFVQFDFDITEDLTLTAGLRVSRIEHTFDSQYGGGEVNQNQPWGMTLEELGLDEPPEPVFYSTVGEMKETPKTPKIGLSYDINDDNMIYVNAAKGFRPGGVTQQFSLSTCAPGLIQLGYVDENGNPYQPSTFDSDSVWSYEVGTKNTLFDNRLSIDASTYIIDWENIQTALWVPICYESLTDNLGEARSQGFDIGFQIYPIHSLEITGTVSYNSTKFTKDIMKGEVLLIRDGAVVPQSPAPWRYTLSAHHNFPLPTGQQFYSHMDFIHSTEHRRVGTTDPEDPTYNPFVVPTEAYSVVNARIGIKWDYLDIALFAENLFNEQPSLFSENRRTMAHRFCTRI
jgi:outer membrane receptor protein involved in Fe transport